MKSVYILLLAVFLTGCAIKKPLATSFATKPECINPVQTQNAACKQITTELFECSHLLVKVSCIKVKTPDMPHVSDVKSEIKKSTP